MLGLNRLASTLRGGLWLVRCGGLRERMDDLERRAESLERLEQERWSELRVRLDGLVQELGALSGQLSQELSQQLSEQLSRKLAEELTPQVAQQFAERLALQVAPALERIDQRTAVRASLADQRWSELGSRLDALTRDMQASDRRNELGLSNIGDTAQSAHDRACDALSKMYQIDDLLRSRSRVFGHEMFLDTSDSIVSPLLLRDGYFEPYETTLIESEIRPGDVVLDIGANIGYYTLIFARLVGERGRVYAFEPDPTNFRLLKKNVRANGYHNVIFIKKAVADAPGRMPLYLCPDNKGDHRLFDSHDNRPSIDIEVTTLDEHFAEFQGEINFIKMDIQGSEARAVRGMERLLQRYPDVRIITEFWPAGLRRSGVEAREYLADLDRHGFRLFRIDEDGETTEPTTPDELLALYPDDREDFSNLYCARSA